MEDQKFDQGICKDRMKELIMENGVNEMIGRREYDQIRGEKN